MQHTPSSSCQSGTIRFRVQPKENFVEINKYNFERVADYYLIHEEERKKIAQAGYEMVHERHSLEARVKELIDMIKPIVKKSDPID